jgi:serine/threonine protein kinase
LDDASLARFAQEIRILGSLDHPNIVKVIDKRLTNYPYFYVMSLYKHSLAAEIPALEANAERINAIMTAVLDATEYAHSEGVLHRDLNPRNVLMDTDSDLVVSDFGLGRVVDAESTRKTDSGYGMGTMLYMPPGKKRGEKGVRAYFRHKPAKSSECCALIRVRQSAVEEFSGARILESTK